MALMSAFILFISCNKFLEEKPDKQLVELNTLNDLQALLDDEDLMNETSTPGFGETSADDYFVSMETFNSLNEFDRGVYIWDVKDYNFDNDWSSIYRGIYPPNYCLDYLQKIERSAQNHDQWNNVKGQALFHRAYRFLGLVWDYGKAFDEASSSKDLGIVLRLSSDPSIPSKRATVRECYERVIQDVAEAAQTLPDNPLIVTRPSKAAAYGLLARCYLSMRKYDSAYKYANLSLQIKNTLFDFNQLADINANAPFPMFNSEIIFYSTQTPNYSTKIMSLIDTLLYSTYKNNDLRKAAYFSPLDGYVAFKGSYSHFGFGRLFTGLTTSEMFIVRAECLARAGRYEAALNDLNAVLEKRWAAGTFEPISEGDSEVVLHAILLERRKELLFRGLRWIDIKRLNMEGYNIVIKRMTDRGYELLPNDGRYALPLPKDIVDLTGMPQN